MHRLFTFFIITISVLACQPESQDTRFSAFLTAHNHWRPMLWPGLQPNYGVPEFNDVIAIPKAKVFLSGLSFCENQLIALEKIDPDKLSSPFKHEYVKIRRFLGQIIHNLEVLKIHETNPAFYSLSPFFENLLRRENIPDERKIDLLTDNLAQFPEYYKNVKTNLKSSSSENLKTALEQEKSLYFMLEKEVPLIFKTAKKGFDTALQAQLLADSKISVKDYIAFLNSLKFEIHNQETDSLQRLPGRAKIEKARRND